MESKDPLKEHQDLLQDSETCHGFRLAPRLPWQEGRGAQRVPNAPGVPVGEQSGWWQRPKARARGSSLGTAGMRGWKVWGQSSRVFTALVWVVMHVHPCSRVFSHARRCPFLGFVWGGKDSGC